MMVKHSSLRQGTSGSWTSKCVMTLLPLMAAFGAGMWYDNVTQGNNNMVLYFHNTSSMSTSTAVASVATSTEAALAAAPQSTTMSDQNDGDQQQLVAFAAFDDDLIPPNAAVDVNIGTNIAPLVAQNGRHRILVDPLFDICNHNAQFADATTTAFCFAVSNYTGFATFFEYNAKTGGSSSLAKMSQETRVGRRFQVLSKRTVLVLQAQVLFHAIFAKKSTIHRLVLDMQGHDLTTLRDIEYYLAQTNMVMHIMAECACPNPRTGKQVHDGTENSCTSMKEFLQSAGYAVKGGCTKAFHVAGAEWGDIVAYNERGGATDFLPMADFAGDKTLPKDTQKEAK